MGFEFSMVEIVVVMVVALIVLGPKQLAEAAKAVGQLYRQIQKLTWELRDSVDLDAIVDGTTKDSGPPAQPNQDTSSSTDKDFLPVSDEKTGPDFYADLLEESRKDTEERAGEPADPEDTEAEGDSPTETVKKEGQE